MAAKAPKNSGSQWQPTELKQIRQLVKARTPVARIAKELGRSVSAIYQRASIEGISLRPKATRTSASR